MTGRSVADVLLRVSNLSVQFASRGRTVRAVNGVDFDLHEKEVLGVVGESGSGKSVTMMAVLGLNPRPAARVTGGSILFEGRDLATLSEREMAKIRGNRIAMVFQDPMTAFNPVKKIGHQIEEMILVHMPGLRRPEAARRAVELLRAVEVPNAEERYHGYPHQFSGGMRQRAMIAMAIANKPRVLIADEPTTALDVTVQAQIMSLLESVRAGTDASTILITHDLGLLAETAQRVLVMYAGRVVESAGVRDVFRRPAHPYTVGLLASLPRVTSRTARLVPIPGAPPDQMAAQKGCPFLPRCGLAAGRALCAEHIPPLAPLGDGRASACHFPEEVPAHAERLLGPRSMPS